MPMNSHVFLTLYEEEHGWGKNQICLNPPPCVDGFGSLESYYLSHFITLFIGLMDFMPWGTFGQVIWGGYRHCPNAPQVFNTSRKSA